MSQKYWQNFFGVWSFRRQVALIVGSGPSGVSSVALAPVTWILRGVVAPYRSRFALWSQGAAAVQAGMGQADARRAEGLPVLPREVLAHTIAYLAIPSSEGDWPATQALLRLSAVCRLVRHWALTALYDVLVLPRHVRDFRRWYSRMRAAQPPIPCVGYVRALFVGIDDVRDGH